jgi:thiol-disulfide isomerase/thioredoxin
LPDVFSKDLLSKIPKPDKNPDQNATPTGHWTEGPFNTSPPRGNAPPADSLADPKDPTFDTNSELKSVIAGFVIDPDGRKAGNLFVQVEPMPVEGRGAPLEVETLPDGSFLMKGLEPGRSYRLTTKATDGTRVLAGRTYAKAPNRQVRITLVEGLQLDDTTRPGLVPKPDLPKSPVKPVEAPGRTVAPEQPLAPPDFSSRGSSSELPEPKYGDLPDAQGGTPVVLPPSRPDLTTTGPQNEWKPPVTNIPGRSGLMDPPPLVPLPRGGTRSEVIRNGAQFTLTDSQARNWTFPRNQPGELILLEFMTTECLPCQKALPGLKALQQKYGARGLVVVGVACDDEPLTTRQAVAERYRTDHALNFPILTETGKKPGALMKKFGVDRYPTAILLDFSGAVLWQGHPNRKDSLIEAIESHLSASQ